MGEWGKGVRGEYRKWVRRSGGSGGRAEGGEWGKGVRGEGGEG